MLQYFKVEHPNENAYGFYSKTGEVKMKKVFLACVGVFMLCSGAFADDSKSGSKDSTNFITQQFKQFAITALDESKSSYLFVKKQVPLYVNEILQWEFYKSLFRSTAITLFLIITVILCIKYPASDDDFNSDGSPENSTAIIKVVNVFMMIILSILFIMSLCIDIPTMIKVKVAPRVIIIEKISELVKSTNKK